MDFEFTGQILSYLLANGQDQLARKFQEEQIKLMQAVSAKTKIVEQQELNISVSLPGTAITRGRHNVTPFLLADLDDRAVKLGIVTVINEKYSFSGLQAERFSPLYKRIQIPQPKRSDSKAFQVLCVKTEFPIGDQIMEEAGWTRKQIHCTPVVQIGGTTFKIFKDEFEELNGCWNASQFLMFAYVKKAVLSCMTMKTNDQIKDSLMIIINFVSTLFDGYEIDIGALIVAASKLSQNEVKTIFSANMEELSLNAGLEEESEEEEITLHQITSPPVILSEQQDQTAELKEPNIKEILTQQIENLERLYPNLSETEALHVKQHLDQMRNSAVDADPVIDVMEQDPALVATEVKKSEKVALERTTKDKSNFLSVIQFKSGVVTAQIPVLPVCAYTPEQPPQIQANNSAQIIQISQKLEQLQNAKLLEALYDENDDGCLSQIVSTNQTESSKALINASPQVLELKTFTDAVRTGAATLDLAQPTDEAEDERVIVVGETIIGRYIVVRNCGNAAFSSCYQVIDKMTAEECCIKVVKRDKEYFDQALDEVRLLKMVQEAGGEKHHVIRLLDYFYYRERLMLVFPMYGSDLYAHQKNLTDQGLESDYTPTFVKHIIAQQLDALSFIHGLALLHLDLKPENVLLSKSDDQQTVLADLGSASFVFDRVHQYIQSRSYRAPEIMLGCCYDQRADVWSLGCVAAELLTGKVLFPNHSCATMLARASSLFGGMKEEMVTAGRASQNYFTLGGALFDNDQFLSPESGCFEQWLFGDVAELTIEQVLLSDFIRQMLKVDWVERPTAWALIGHPALVE